MHSKFVCFIFIPYRAPHAVCGGQIYIDPTGRFLLWFYQILCIRMMGIEEVFGHILIFPNSQRFSYIGLAPSELKILQIAGKSDRHVNPYICWKWYTGLRNDVRSQMQWNSTSSAVLIPFIDISTNHIHKEHANRISHGQRFYRCISNQPMCPSNHGTLGSWDHVQSWAGHSPRLYDCLVRPCPSSDRKVASRWTQASSLLHF